MGAAASTVMIARAKRVHVSTAAASLREPVPAADASPSSAAPSPVASNARPVPTNAGAPEVMLSINVSTMGPSAARLAAWLEARGVRVWVCTSSLCGGEDYREGIVRAVKRCAVFVPLINEKWARSGECKDEFNLAKRLHLTSAEAGRSAPGAPRVPALVPIAFAGLDWDAHSHVELLAASTNFIVHAAVDLDHGEFEATALQLAVALVAQAGIAVRGVDASSAPSAAAGAAPAPAGMPRRAANGAGELAALEAAQAQLAMVQRTVTQARDELDERRRREQRERAAAVQSFPVDKLGRGYLGTAITTVDGCRHVWTVDFRWVIGPESAPASGVHALEPALLIASPIACTALDETAAARARAALFAQLIDADAKAYVSLAGGTFSTKSGMICVQGGGYMEARELDVCLRALSKAEASADTDDELRAQVEVETRKAALGATNRLIYPRCPYRMLLSSNGDEMYGVFDRPPDTAVDGKSDRAGVPEWSAPLRLRSYA